MAGGVDLVSHHSRISQCGQPCPRCGRYKTSIRIDTPFSHYGRC
ncbi:zinc finger domain-containing protein [Sanguibacter sp. A247]